ncbi:non-ribosomal peptide synthetase [Mucilaginibacter hurinus]|nr:non-ribosomal peptide synthetase [Mucilaginibacter hurinus]
MREDFNELADIRFSKFEKQWLEIPVFELFASIALKYPEKIAVKDDEIAFTYRDLHALAISIASVVASHTGAGREPIGIALPNNPYFQAAMLAALSIGCPYVPLDIDLPPARNQLIIEQSGLSTIITTADINEIPDALTRVNIDQLLVDGGASFKPCAQPEDVAYIIYTSGSTGMPKGVYQNQRNLLHDVMQYVNAVHLSASDKLTLLYSPAVGGSVRDIYGSLLCGATLCIKSLKKSGLYSLVDFIDREKITIYHSIPNIFRTFLKLNQPQKDLSSVRLIYLAGDRIFNPDINLYNKFFGKKCLVYIGIGATEVATIYRHWLIDHDTKIDQELVPVGYAVDDRRMQLLDNDGNEVPNGEAGEIVVSSAYLALGYWNDSEQTHKSFAFNPEHPGIRIYRTGDLGRINGQGLLEFIGRKDNQVKINGYRVEISEIEGMLMDYSGVEKCGVVTCSVAGNNALFAFYTSNKQLDEVALKLWLGTKLPGYMVPKRCIQITEMPLLHNFKNDTITLKEWANAYANVQLFPDQPYEPGDKDALNKLLRTTWGQFLDVSSFDKNMAWSDAGGDSIGAANFLVQLESDLGITLPTEWIHGGMKPVEILKVLEKTIAAPIKTKDFVLFYFTPIKGISEDGRSLVRLLGAENIEIRIIHYPDILSLPDKRYNWPKISKSIVSQLNIDIENTRFGFLSNCNGSNFLLNATPLHILKKSSFIGVVDPRTYHKKRRLKHGPFMYMLTELLKRQSFNTVMNEIFRQYPVLISIVRKLHKDFLNHRNLFILLNHRNKIHYIDNKLYFFSTRGELNIRIADYLKPFFTSIELINLDCEHRSMFDNESSTKIKDKILHVIRRTGTS